MWVIDQNGDLINLDHVKAISIDSKGKRLVAMMDLVHSTAYTNVILWEVDPEMSDGEALLEFLRNEIENALMLDLRVLSLRWASGRFEGGGSK